MVSPLRNPSWPAPTRSVNSISPGSGSFTGSPRRIFWVYGFPTVLAVCLGLAFQSRPPESVQVDLVEGPGLARVWKRRSATTTRRPAPSGRAGLVLTVVPRDEALRRLRTGKTPLVVEPAPSGPLVYRYDPTRPEAGPARVGRR